MAQFRVGLRIDAALVQRDLAALQGIASATAAARANSNTGATSNTGGAITLRRADGSGWCVKVRLTSGRVRWRCD